VHGADPTRRFGKVEAPVFPKRVLRAEGSALVGIVGIGIGIGYGWRFGVVVGVA
jgi:hypothetical protein